jgi:ribosomal protein S18 acetylase RimI-like enzyme
VDSFLKELKKKGIGVRDFEAAVNNGCVDRFDFSLGNSGLSARRLYEGLGFSDQGQIREFYLERLEKVDVALRARYAQVYRVL